jgi:hypothetical protein
MILDNEWLNRLVREGEGITVLSSSPTLGELVDDVGKMLQASDLVPLSDALRAILASGRRLADSSGSPPEEVVIALDKTSLEKSIQSVVRVPLPQGSLLDEKPLPKKIEADFKVVEQAHKIAEQAAALVDKDLRLPMEQLVAVLEKSGNRELTENFLVESGPGRPGFVGPSGPLPALKAEMPPTLPASKAVDLLVRVWSVKERDGYARVEIKKYLDARARKVLAHHTSEVTLHFDSDSVQRDDLMAAQYLRREIRIRAAAECAILERYARKTILTLVGVRESRAALDQLHVMARQFEFQFENEGDGQKSVREAASTEMGEE